MTCTLGNTIQWNDVVGADTYEWELLNAAAGLVLNDGVTAVSEVDCLTVFDELEDGNYNFRVRAVRGESASPYSALLPLEFTALATPTGLTVA